MNIEPTPNTLPPPIVHCMRQGPWTPQQREPQPAQRMQSFTFYTVLLCTSIFSAPSGALLSLRNQHAMCMTGQLSGVVDGKPDACTYANLFQNIAFFTVIAAAYIIAMVAYFSSFPYSSRDHWHIQLSITPAPFSSKKLRRALAIYQIICIAILQGSAYFLSPPVVAVAGSLVQLCTAAFAIIMIKSRVRKEEIDGYSWTLLLERDFGSLAHIVIILILRLQELTKSDSIAYYSASALLAPSLCGYTCILWLRLGRYRCSNAGRDKPLLDAFILTYHLFLYAISFMGIVAILSTIVNGGMFVVFCAILLTLNVWGCHSSYASKWNDGRVSVHNAQPSRDDSQERVISAINSSQSETADNSRPWHRPNSESI